MWLEYDAGLGLETIRDVPRTNPESTWSPWAVGCRYGNWASYNSCRRAAVVLVVTSGDSWCAEHGAAYLAARFRDDDFNTALDPLIDVLATLTRKVR